MRDRFDKSGDVTSTQLYCSKTGTNNMHAAARRVITVSLTQIFSRAESVSHARKLMR